MVVVLMTDVRQLAQATNILAALRHDFPSVRFNFDMDDYVDKPFPCGHTVLRAEGMNLSAEKIISLVTQVGFQCQVLEDKVCH